MRVEKIEMLAQMRSALEGASCVILTEYRGLSVAQFEQTRKALDGVGARMRVVRNRLVARAAADAGMPGLGDYLQGPCALVYGSGDAVETAKCLKTCVKEGVPLVIRGGVLQGAILPAEMIAELADLPSRLELLGRLAGTLAAPMTQLAGVMHQKTASIVYVLKALEESKNQAA